MKTVQPNASILIVEDESPIRELLAEVLEDEGYPVSSATNGQEALTLLRRSSTLPKLILLDLNMPVMSGWEFRQVQQTDPELERIPVVVISASSTIKQQHSTIQADGYLPKPLDIDRLLNTVEQYYSTG